MNLAAFLQPGFLWAASLLAVPLIIHLLNRRRVRVVTWAAMDFLLAAFQKRKRRMRLENLLLLLLRCAIPVLLAMVMARPFFGPQNLLALLAEDTREVVVVLDHSYSMGRQLGAGTAYESAQTQIRRLLDQLDGDKGDTFTLVTMAKEAEVRVLRSPARQDWDAALARLERPSYERGDLVRVVEALQGEVLPEIPSQAEIFLFSDFQRDTFEGPLTSDTAVVDEGFETLADRLRKMSETSSIHLVNLADGVEDAANLTAFDLRATEPVVLAGQNVQLTASIRARGDAVPASATGRFLIGDTVRQVPLSFDKDGRASVDIYHVFPSAGDHDVRFELEDDDLLDDNSRYYRLSVRENLPVLVVDGDPRGGELDGEVGDLLLVLDPAFGRILGDGARRFFDPVWISYHEFNQGRLNLGDYVAVLLANVRDLEPRVAESLENYVQRGGSAWFFLGDQVVPQTYNDRLYRPDGSGLLPFLLEAPVGEVAPTVASTADDGGMARMVIEDELHPMVRTFVDGQRRSYFSSPVWRYYPMTEPAEALPGLRVPARFDTTGHPALVDHVLGGGHVIWFPTSIEAESRWSLFVANTNAVFPLVWDTMSYLVLRDPDVHQLPIGGAIRKAVPFAPSPFTMTLPDGAIRRITEVPQEPQLGYFPLPPFDETRTPGFYTLDLPLSTGLTLREVYAVNVDPDEGDLRSLDREELLQLLDSKSFQYLTEIRDQDQTEANQRQGEIWKNLLLALLVVMAVESVLAWRFGAYS